MSMQVGNIQQQGDPWSQSDPWGQASTVAPNDSASQVGIQRPQMQQPGSQPVQHRGNHGTSGASQASTVAGKGAGTRMGIGHVDAVICQTTQELYEADWVLSMVDDDKRR